MSGEFRVTKSRPSVSTQVPHRLRLVTPTVNPKPTLDEATESELRALIKSVQTRPSCRTRDKHTFDGGDGLLPAA